MNDGENSLPQVIVGELLKVISPMQGLRTRSATLFLLRNLGWEAPQDAIDTVTTGFSTIANSVATVRRFLDELNQSGNLDDIISVSRQVKGLYTSIEGISDGLVGGNDFIDNSGIKTEGEMFRRLLDYLIVNYLRKYHPRIYSLTKVAGLIIIVQNDPPPVYHTRQGYFQINWAGFPTLFSAPHTLMANYYQWGADDLSNPENPQGGFRDDRFFQNLLELMWAFNLSGGQYSGIGGIKELRYPIFKDSAWGGDSYQEIGLAFCAMPAQSTLKRGVSISPYYLGGGEVEKKFDIGGKWDVTLTGSLSEDFRASLLLRPNSDPVWEITGQEGLDGGICLKLVQKDGKDIYFIGSENDSLFLLMRGAQASVSLKSEGNDWLGLEMDIRELALAIKPDLMDGFLAKVFPSDGVKLKLGLGVGWTKQDGLSFSGGVGLGLSYPVHRSILKVISLEIIYIETYISDTGLENSVTASFSVTLGPVTASVEKVGLGVNLVFPKDSALDFSLGFKPPTGVGLSINASGITGGGFLIHDEDNGLYAGGLGLNFGKIALTAIGMVTTKMPDGSKGFALLINIGVTFDPAIQLPLGFNLSGVGGLIAINHTMNIDALRVGVRNHTLNSILFPDPATVVANANQIISDLRTVFPVQEGQFIIGPMVRFGWGGIITGELGVFIELPDPVRIVLMGQIEAILPKKENQTQKENQLVVIHLDILGVVDFEQKEMTFQASLYDSRILTYTLSGDSAFLLGWGNDPRFALSLGGFHPKFTPPPSPTIFAGMKRLSLNISSGGSLQLSCSSYFALTTNSLQFGAGVYLYASAGGLEVEGGLNFDAIFIFSPFSFEVSISGGVEVSYEGCNLFGVNLDFVLSGPTPWHARGKVRFKLMFVTVKKSFSFTWGNDQQTLPAAIDPWHELKPALQDPGNWNSVLPSGEDMVESLRSLKAEENTGVAKPLIVHPSGRLEVRQNVVPLGVTLQKLGSSTVKDHNYFDIGDETLAIDPVEDYFSRGQYQELSEDQKLSLPSFEKMKAGGTVRASGMVRVNGNTEEISLQYESRRIGPDWVTAEKKTASANEMYTQKISAVGVARKLAQRHGPQNRFMDQNQTPKVTAGEERYCVVNAKNLTCADIKGNSDENMSRMKAEEVLAAQVNANPGQAGKYLVVPVCEVAE